jgi:hypothetical protein
LTKESTAEQQVTPHQKGFETREGTSKSMREGKRKQFFMGGGGEYKVRKNICHVSNDISGGFELGLFAMEIASVELSDKLGHR